MAFLASACSGATDEVAPEPIDSGSDVESPSASDTRTSPKTIEEVVTEIDEQLIGELVNLELDHEGEPGRIYARWDIAIDSTNEAIIDGARLDSVTILRSIARSGINYEEVWLSGWFTITVDINLNTEHTEMVSLFYDRETLEPRNWDGIRSQYIWLISDRGNIHWLFVE
jgi:hypothetical protein